MESVTAPAEHVHGPNCNHGHSHEHEHVHGLDCNHGHGEPKDQPVIDSFEGKRKLLNLRLPEDDLVGYLYFKSTLTEHEAAFQEAKAKISALVDAAAVMTAEIGAELPIYVQTPYQVQNSFMYVGFTFLRTPKMSVWKMAGKVQVEEEGKMEQTAYFEPNRATEKGMKMHKRLAQLNCRGRLETVLQDSAAWMIERQIAQPTNQPGKLRRCYVVGFRLCVEGETPVYMWAVPYFKSAPIVRDFSDMTQILDREEWIDEILEYAAAKQHDPVAFRLS